MLGCCSEKDPKELYSSLGRFPVDCELHGTDLVIPSPGHMRAFLPKPALCDKATVAERHCSPTAATRRKASYWGHRTQPPMTRSGPFDYGRWSQRIMRYRRSGWMDE